MIFQKKGNRTSGSSHVQARTAMETQTRIIRRKNTGLLTYLFLGLVIFGIIIGCIIGRLGKENLFSFLFSDFISETAYPFAYIIKIFAYDLAVSAVIFLLGVWAVSAPITFLIVILYGIAMGMTVSASYIRFGICGVVAAIILYISSKVIMIFPIVYCGEQSFRMSLYFFAFTFEKNFQSIGTSNQIFKNYFKSYITVLPWILLSTIVRTIVVFTLRNFVISICI